MTTLLTPGGRPAFGCKNCKHAVTKDNQMLCTLNPPSVFPLIHQNEKGLPFVALWATAWPPVHPDTKCGQHALAAQVH